MGTFASELPLGSPQRHHTRTLKILVPNEAVPLTKSLRRQFLVAAGSCPVQQEVPFSRIASD
jgi:hypothetical protein